MMMMEAIDIKVLSEAVPVRVEDDGVVVDQGGAEKRIPVDCLVFAGRMIPENELSKSLEGMNNVFSVGDCVNPERIMEAVWSAFKTVREIEP
jgi:NADH dehydrogenase FAD-containing subunit